MTKKQVFVAAVKLAYAARRQRRVNPEGGFDRKGRWYPSDREDADGDGSSTRSPSRAWPYSYLLRCRTRQHVRVLVGRALARHDVPEDISRALAEAAGLRGDTSSLISADYVDERCSA